MRIGHKLTIGFSCITLLVTFVGFVSVYASQHALQDRIEHSSHALVSEILNRVDERVYHRIEIFQEYVESSQILEALAESNKTFESSAIRDEMIVRRDKEWISAPPDVMPASMLKITNNELSQALRDKIAFYAQNCEYKVFGEVFITNKYGANIAQTNRTSDYYQADEPWWQEVQTHGLLICDVAHDKSAGVFSTDICIRIDDRLGEFQGVLKVVLNIEESIALIRNAAQQDQTAEFKLLNKDWRILYSAEDYEFLSLPNSDLISSFTNTNEQSHKNHFIVKQNAMNEGDKLCSFAQSKGHKEFKGLGWILAIEQDRERLFAPVRRMKKHILGASLAITLLVVAIGLIISNSIGTSLAKLTHSAREIGAGNLNTRVDIHSTDEFSILAHSFNSMAHNLSEITTSKETLSQEIDIRAQAEEDVQTTKAALEQQIKDLALSQSAILNMMEDIDNENTERRQAETLLEQARQEAEAANVAKSRFLANMSHEIRTPMNAILGFSEILNHENLTDQQQCHVAMIRNSGKHLLQLINDILDFSKIEAGKLDVTPRECLLTNLLAGIEGMMSTLMTKKDLDFQINFITRVPERLHTDSDRVVQCLINLVNNAIKFTNLGHVHLNVSMEYIENIPFIRFDVEDSGIGIPLEKQQKIFESFSQADARTSRQYGGTGLGLTITKQLTELLRGTIHVASKEGEGSTFSISIPVDLTVTQEALLDKYDPATITHVPRPRLAHVKFSGHVLVVEDVQANQMLVKLMLERLNLKVTLADDGLQAIEMASSQNFDLVFMDTEMPRMNGHDATRSLRDAGVKTPIVALTAHAMQEEIETCLACGCNGFLSKPISRDDLVEVLHQYGPLHDQTQQNSSSDSENPPAQSDIAAATQTSSQQPQEVETNASISDTNHECILDWTHLINRVGDKETVRDIIPCYLESNRDHLAELTQAVKEKHAEHIAFHAHSLKGAGLNLGAEHVSQVAHQLERTSRQGDLSNSTLLLEKLTEEFMKLNNFMAREDWMDIAEKEIRISDQTLYTYQAMRESKVLQTATTCSESDTTCLSKDREEEHRG